MQQFVTFVIHHWVLFLALVLILALLAATYVKDKLLGFKDLGPQEVTRLINQQDAVILDVREGTEFKQGHIVNARSMPLEDLERQINRLEKVKDKPIVVTCQNGQRSARAAAILRGQGFEKVFKLGGGLQAWREAKFPLSAK